MTHLERQHQHRERAGAEHRAERPPQRPSRAQEPADDDDEQRREERERENRHDDGEDGVSRPSLLPMAIVLRHPGQRRVGTLLEEQRRRDCC